MKIAVNNSRREQQAFTLVDVMMSMGILGIILLSLFASFTFGFSVVRMTREEVQATQVLQERMELIRLDNWKTVTNNAVSNFTVPFGPGSARVFNVTVSNSIPSIQSSPDYASDLRRIDVSISWTNNDIKRVRSTSTYVSRYGLQNFRF